MLFNFNNYIPRHSGREAFESDFATSAVVFEIVEGKFVHWNPEPEMLKDEWNEGLPFGYTIEEIEEYGFDLPELAKQLGIYHAWGLDL